DGAARAAAADRDVQVARLRIDSTRGRGKSVVAGRFEEDARLGGVSCALRFESGEVNLAESPVAQEEAALVFLWELVVGIAGNAGRRAAAQRGDRGHAIAEIGRPPPRERPLRVEPAVVPALDHVVKSRRLVPRQADTALVVGIEGEQVAGEVEVEAVG